MLLPPIRARKKVSGKCRPATMPELRNFAFDSRVVTLVANTMTSPGFLFKNIRASPCRIYIWNLAFSSFYWQLVSSLRDRPCMGLARLASHVLREMFFLRETCLLVSEEFMFFQPKTRIPRRDVYKLLCGLESWRTPLKRCGRFAPRSKKRNRQAELCVRIPPTKVSLARFFLCLLSCLSRVRRFSSPEFIFRAHKSHFPKSETKIARKSYFAWL